MISASLLINSAYGKIDIDSAVNPTSAARPRGARQSTAWRIVFAEPINSSATSTPVPAVASLICSTGSAALASIAIAPILAADASFAGLISIT